MYIVNAVRELLKGGRLFKEADRQEQYLMICLVKNIQPNHKEQPR